VLLCGAIDYQTIYAQPAAINAVNIGTTALPRYAIITTNRVSVGSALTPAAAATGAITTADSTPVAANTNRRGLVICNAGIAGVYLSLDGNAAVASYGIYLAPNGGTWTMDTATFTTAAVHAITAAGTSTLSIQEFT